MRVAVETHMSETFIPNSGKELETIVDGTRYVRLPLKTRLITKDDDLALLLEEYARPHLVPGDVLFVSEKVVCITQDRIIPTASVQTGWLARLLSRQVRNYAGTPQFRGLGHGTAPAMQLLIDEAGVLRVLFATLVSALTRPLGIKGAFYYLVGKQAKSIDCPMSWTIEEYKDFAKRAPHKPYKVARELAAHFGVDVVIVDANYRGAFSLGKSNRAHSEKWIQAIVRDNPAGQDSEMTPFLIIRPASA